MFNTLMLAVDINDPDGAVRSTEAAVRMASQESAVLHILNVVPDQGMSIVSASMANDYNETVLDSSQTALTQWVKETVPSELSVELHVARGTVYDQIIKMADHLNVDCIFVGAHSPSLKDYLIGPNAARVARHASQSVFVIR